MFNITEYPAQEHLSSLYELIIYFYHTIFKMLHIFIIWIINRKAENLYEDMF